MKKKIPLVILEALQPIADNNLDLIYPVRDDNSMFHLIDKDERSDFYFRVTKQEARNGVLNYLVEYKPKSNTNVNPHSNWQTIESVKVSIRSWLELLQSYNKIHTVYDDPIIKSNQERFEKQFEILDADADLVSFDLSQQLYLDEYLDGVKSRLIELQANKSDSEKKELEELVAEAADIQKHITKETKRKVVKRLSRFWAKTQKVGLDVLKEVFIGVTTELTKQLLT